MDTDKQPAAPIDTAPTDVEQSPSVDAIPTGAEATPINTIPASVAEATPGETSSQSAAVPTAPIEAASSETLTTPLPGVITLIKSGFGIYRERIVALVDISILQALSFFFIFIPVATALFLRGHIVIDIITTLLSTIVVVWLYFWLMLTSMEIIRGHAQKVSLRQALHMARTKTLPFVWMLIIAFLIIIGTGTLLSILSSVVIASLGVISGMNSLAVVVGGAAVIVSFIAVGILFSIWFLFSYWVFVDEDKKRIDALVASRELIRKNVGAIFWRLIATSFLVYIAYYVVSLLNPLLFSGVEHSVVGILLYLTSALFLAPLMLSIVYVLFRSVKVRVGAEVQHNEKLHKYFRWYAVFGAVVVVLFAIVMFAMGGSVMQALMRI